MREEIFEIFFGRCLTEGVRGGIINVVDCLRKKFTGSKQKRRKEKREHET